MTPSLLPIPETAQSLEFFARVKDTEIFRTGRLTASISLNGTNFQPIGSFDLTATSSLYSPHTFSLNNTSLGNMSGKTGYIRFELTHPGTGLQLGIDRVYIDDVRLLGVGLPLQAESTGVTTSNASPQVAQASITSLIEIARSQWEGLVKAPEGVGETALGLVGITATDLALDKGAGASLKYSEADRDTRGSESGFNDQLFLANTNTVFTLGTVDQQPITDKFAFNGNASFASDRHTVDTEPDARLGEGESTVFLSSVVNENIAPEPNVHEHWTTVGDRPICIADLNGSSDLPAPGGEGTVAELDVLDLQKVSLVPLVQSPTLLGHGNGLVGVPPFFNAASGLGKGEGKQNQNMLQHNLSFGSLTLPPDRSLVNQSASFGTGFVGLTADQLALLNKATITIADLVDGYLDRREWGHCLTLHFDEQFSARAQIDFSPTATTPEVGVVQPQATTARLAPTGLSCLSGLSSLFG